MRRASTSPIKIRVVSGIDETQKPANLVGMNVISGGVQSVPKGSNAGTDSTDTQEAFRLTFLPCRTFFLRVVGTVGCRHAATIGTTVPCDLYKVIEDTDVLSVYADRNGFSDEPVRNRVVIVEWPTALRHQPCTEMASRKVSHVEQAFAVYRTIQARHR